MSSDSEFNDLQRKAKLLARSGEWGKTAIEINTRMLEIDDRAADAYTRLARCFRKQGRLIAAREMYSQVLTFDSNNTIARNNLAEIEKQIGRADELSGVSSICSFDEAFSVGVAARKRKRYALAIAALLRAIELRPESVHAWNALGAANRHKGSLSQAARVYDHAMRLSRNIVSLTGLAAVARDSHEPDKAISLYTEVLKGAPDHAYALNGLGGVYADIGRFDKAEEYFKRASELSEGREDAVRGLEKLRLNFEAQRNIEAAKRISRWLAQLAEKVL